MSTIAVATSTFYKDAKSVRAQLAVRTVLTAAQHYPVTIIDAASDPRFLEQIAHPAVRVLAEPKGSSMGGARRIAMTAAAELNGSTDAIVVWMEPEKLDFVKSIGDVTAPIASGDADLVIPARASLDSYPPEQAHAERIGNLAVQYLTGQELDFWFGPMAMNWRALTVVTDYDGTDTAGHEYGDKWDSLMVPRLRAIKASLQVVPVEVDYIHPADQTDEETGDVDMLMKRVDQLRNIVPALEREAQRLGLVKAAATK